MGGVTESASPSGPAPFSARRLGYSPQYLLLAALFHLVSVGVRVLLMNVGLLSGVVGFVQLVSVGVRFRCESVVGLDMGVGSRFV